MSDVLALSPPRRVARADRPTLGLHAAVTMGSIMEVAPRLFGELAVWLRSHPDDVAGDPFIRYHVIDMSATLQIEVGVPIRTALPGDGRLRAGVLPAGTYLEATHVGPYDRLEAATGAFLAAARELGVRWDVRDGPGGEEWGCRLEFYPTDPFAEPDPATWVTLLSFRTAE